MEVYIIRHTKVVVSKGTCYGQFDVPLADDFLTDIFAVKQKLPEHFDKVFSSPSSRCSILAQHISSDVIEYSDQLLEMNFGEWENKNWDDIAPDQLKIWMDDFVFVKTPQGESLELLHERVVQFIEWLRLQDYQKVAITTHAGVIRCIWAHYLSISLDKIFKIPVNYGDGLKINLSKDSNLDTITKTAL